MSDIIFLVAKIGGGKSLNATMRICEELERSERMICTTVPLKIPEMQEYCQKYIKRPIDLNKRLRVLTKNEAKRWFFFLPNRNLLSEEDFELSLSPRLIGDGNDRKDPRKVQAEVDRLMAPVAERQALRDGGCLYVLDEVHLLFPARDWQLAGPLIEPYVSQLRKLNDDLLLITQHPEKTDKNFRRNATGWFYIKNLGKSRMLLGVGFPDRFRWSYYETEPTRTDKPEGQGFFNMKERNYHELYDTMAGVGFAGNIMADEKAKVGHWSRWVIALAVLVAVGVAFPYVATWATGRVVGISMKGLSNGLNQTLGITNSHVPGVVSPVSQVPMVPSLAPGQSQHVQPVDTNVVYMTGWLWIAEKPRVYLSDGTTIMPDKFDRERGAYKGDRFYPWAKPDAQTAMNDSFGRRVYNDPNAYPKQFSNVRNHVQMQ